MADLPSPLTAMAAAQMSGGQPDPNTISNYFDAQKQQMLASMLMGNMQQQNQTPADWNQMRLVPKRSALSGISGIASALMAGKAMNKSMGAQQAYMQSLYPQQGNQSPQGGQGSAQGAQASTQSPQGGQSPQQGTIPGTGATLPAAIRAMVMGVPGADKIVEQGFKYLAPADIQAQIRAAGIDPNSSQGQQIAMRSLQKNTYIAPIEQRAGSIERDPVSNQVIGQNPSLPTGGVNFYDQGGNLTGSGMSPGATGAIADSAGAAEAGRVANQYTTLPTAGGGSTVVGGPHTGISQPRSYFPTPTVQSGAGAAPSSPQPQIDPSSPWAKLPKLENSTAIGSNPILEGRMAKEKELDAAQATEFGNNSELANNALNFNAEARKALPNAEVGPLSSWLTNSRSSLSEMLGNPSWLPSSGKITPTYVVNKNLLNASLQGAKATYGRMTASEVMLQKNEMSPSIATTRQAVSSLMQQSDARSAYAIQMGNDYNKYVDAGGKPSAFKPWYTKNFPLQDFAQRYVTPKPAIDLLKQHPETAPLFKQKYGWLPDGS